MRTQQSRRMILRSAQDLDDAIERKDKDTIVSMFDEDCEIELLGVILKGRAGVRRWLAWLYDNLVSIKLTPITIMVERDVFFEEFVVEAKLINGAEISSKQSEVLVYAKNKVKSLRLYFDRLEFAGAVANDIFSRALVSKIIKLSLKGLL